MTVVYRKYECPYLCNGDREGKSKNSFNRGGIILIHETEHTQGIRKSIQYGCYNQYNIYDAVSLEALTLKH